MVRRNYFSIDDILAEEPRVYASFQVRGHMIGHLDPMGASLAENDKENDVAAANDADETPSVEVDREFEPGSHIAPGRKVALPYWMCETLAERGAVELHAPVCFGASTRNQLDADALVVPLYSKCPYFYTLGLRLADFCKSATILSTLFAAYAERCWFLVDKAAYGSAVGYGGDAIQKLDLRERELYFLAHGMSVALNRWKERTSDRIRSTSSILGKRRRASRDSDFGSPITPRQRIR